MTHLQSADRCRCVLVDTSILRRELLVELLHSGQPSNLTVRATDDSRSATELCRQWKPRLLLLKIQFARDASAHVFEEMRRAAENLRVLVYSEKASKFDISMVLQRGVDGFLSDGLNAKALLAAALTVAGGGNSFCALSKQLLSEIARGDYAGERRNSLSPREIEILRLISAGHTTKEMASLLGLSSATVDTHRRNAMAKTGARNAADLIRFGHEHGLLSV